MAVPKRKTSKSRARTARAARKLTVATLQECPRCSATTRPHTVCDNCGHYKGREVIAKDEF